LVFGNQTTKVLRSQRSHRTLPRGRVATASRMSRVEPGKLPRDLNATHPGTPRVSSPRGRGNKGRLEREKGDPGERAALVRQSAELNVLSRLFVGYLIGIPASLI
jgi:hypothetical protein